MPFNPLSWLTSPPAPAPAPAAAAAAAPPPTLPTPTPSPPTETTPAAAPRPTEARRQLKQLTLLLSGSAFLALSILTTRRTLAQRRLALTPPFYHPNTRPPLVPPNGALDALQALNLATLNTTAFAIFLVGGGMVALDVCTLEELRERARGAAAAVGEAEREAEEEFEEWLVGVLARKEKKEEVRRRVKEEMEREREREREKAGGGR